MKRRRKAGSSPTRPIRHTRGRELLGRWLEKRGRGAQQKLADDLDVKQPLVSAWLKGLARPGSDLRESLQRMCGIPTAAWLDARESAAVARLPKAS